MEFPDLNETAKTAKVIAVKYDGDIVIEFDNGIRFYIEADTEWNVGVLRVESSTEREWKESESKRIWAERQEAEEAKKLMQQKILDQFPPEQWPKIRKTFK